MRDLGVLVQEIKEDIRFLGGKKRMTLLGRVISLWE